MFIWKIVVDGGGTNRAQILWKRVQYIYYKTCDLCSSIPMIYIFTLLFFRELGTSASCHVGPLLELLGLVAIAALKMSSAGAMSDSMSGCVASPSTFACACASSSRSAMTSMPAPFKFDAMMSLVSAWGWGVGMPSLGGCGTGARRHRRRACRWWAAPGTSSYLPSRTRTLATRHVMARTS